jgi:hypothetical protein
MPRSLEDLIAQFEHLSVILILHMAQSAVHQSRYFLLVSLMVDFPGTEVRNYGFKGSQGSGDVAFLNVFDPYWLFSLCLDDFFLKFHIESIFSFAEVVQSNSELDSVRNLLKAC